MKPTLLVVAGPNGAGKTTVTKRLRAETRWSDGAEYINPDDVALERFGDWNSLEAVKQAADWAAARREDLLRRREGIAFETVFSTDDKVDFLARARDADYFIRVFFIGTSDPTINAARVATRVIQGGHDVPITKIVRRYERSIANLSAAIALADRAYIYDNSIDGIEAALCARTTSGRLRKIYGRLPAWIAAAVEGLDRDQEFVDLRVR